MSFKINKILSEQSLSGKKTKPLVDAIKNRNPVTFYYSGPKKPEKESVKSGTRIRAEVVAMGLSKRGNVIVRAYVQPPSVSKKGYSKTNWRTFIVDRMSNISVLTDETFDTKRPGYKEGAESNRGPMVTTYVTSDWTKTPDVKPKETPPTPEPKPIEKPTKEPLPQPKVDKKPPAIPQQPKDHVGDIFKTISPKDVNGQKVITTQEYQKLVGDLYKRKETDWKKSQQELGKNTSPGEGTRKKFDIDSNKELSNILKTKNITVLDNLPTEPENINQPLQERLSRIKTLMLLIN
jgi:hypothetical protein